MTRITTRIAALREERKGVESELTQVRLRSQALEARLLRLEGALTVLEELAADTPTVSITTAPRWQPVAS